MGEYSEAFVAFDVSKRKYAVAIADGGRGSEVRFIGEIANTPAAVERLIGKLGSRYDKLHFCYEDGVIPARRFRFRETRRILRRDGAPSHQPEDPPCTSSASMFRRRRSALCILDSNGKIVRETKLPSDPEIIARFIADTGLAIERIGLELGCTAAWLFAGLQRYGWPVICIDARHAAAALQAGFRNKNDRNDARGIADLMRVNKYRPVWVKSPEAQRQGRLLTARATLQSQLVALENTIRGLLRQEGIGLTDRRTAFEAAVREVIAEDCLLHAAVHPLLETRNAVLCQRAALDRQILLIVRADPVCRLLMTAPGVGTLVALTFKVAVDDPGRFSRSRYVGAHFGLTPRERSSGELPTRSGSAKWATTRFDGCCTWRPAACCGVMRHYGVRSKHGPCAWRSA